MRVFGVDLIVPSPEQGTSKRILSNFGKFDFDKLLHKATASFRETIAFVTPVFSKFETKTLRRPRFSSFATIVPEPSIFAAICVVFDPGEANKSKTNSSGCGSRAMTDNIDETS